MTKQYDKLVRDNIPELIERTGQHCRVEVLDEQRYRIMLERKLSEELGEYLESGRLEELADLLEVMQALVAARGEQWQQLEQLRQSKRKARGGFEKRLLLTAVSDGEQ